ncbi:AG10A glucosyltransferase, partial [Alcedo cyanopectus]|nr:AG10A glucosyltransferase [Ceyx cyanopectus]
MERAEAYGFSAALSGSFLLSCLLFAALNRRQRGPYMDEAFHVPQAQAYCHGRFLQWDPMITTLPGLYLLSAGAVKPAAWLLGWSGSVVCSAGMLRFINLLFGAGNLCLLYSLLTRIHRNKAVSGFQRILSSLTLAMFPTLYFFTFLYYTDPGSVFFTLFAYLMCLCGNHKTSALLGFCGFMFRQTNIVWVVFCAGSVVAEKLNEAWKTQLQKKKDEKLSSRKESLPDLLRVLQFLIEYLTSPKNLLAVTALTWPYMVLVAMFFAFVLTNGGIVVGDRSSHEACLHFPQLFYFLSFTAFFSFPHLLTPTKVRRFLQSLRQHPVQYSLVSITSLLLIWKFTYVHKYLLADNRHYTFYVWRKVFQRHELVKYLLVPAYVFAGWSFTDALRSKSVFWILVYFVCLLAATVPQRLLEFRYFILPFLIYRLNIPFPSLHRQLVELAFYVAVNAVSFYLFLNKTFQWPNSDEIQRFMW